MPFDDDARELEDAEAGLAAVLGPRSVAGRGSGCGRARGGRRRRSSGRRRHDTGGAGQGRDVVVIPGGAGGPCLRQLGPKLPAQAGHARGVARPPNSFP